MSQRVLVLYDPAPRDARVLESGLRKAGFIVRAAIDALALDARLAEGVPDAVLLGAAQDAREALALVDKLRADKALARVPVVLVCGKIDAEARAHAERAHVDAIVAKPVSASELSHELQVVRIRRLREAIGLGGDAGTKLSGALDELSVGDLLLTCAAGHATGVVTVDADGQRARVWLRDGKVVDAEVGALRGEEAVFRALVLVAGTFVVELVAVEAADVIESSTDEVVAEGLRRASEIERLLGELPPLEARVDVAHGKLAERLGNIPDELNGILKLIDGKHTLRALLDASPFDDVSTLATLAKLREGGLLIVASEEPTAIPPPVAHGVEITRDVPAVVVPEAPAGAAAKAPQASKAPGEPAAQPKRRADAAHTWMGLDQAAKASPGPIAVAKAPEVPHRETAAPPTAFPSTEPVPRAKGGVKTLPTPVVPAAKTGANATPAEMPMAKRIVGSQTPRENRHVALEDSHKFFTTGDAHRSPPAVVEEDVPYIVRSPEQVARRAAFMKLVGGVVGVLALVAIYAVSRGRKVDDRAVVVPPIGSSRTTHVTAEVPSASASAAAAVSAAPSASAAVPTGPAPLPRLEVVPPPGSPAEQKAWERAREGIVADKFDAADAAFSELTKSTDPTTKESARFARALWWTVHGRADVVRGVFTDLAANATSPDIKQRASQIAQ